MDFLQRTPFFKIIVPFIGGIVLFQYFHFSNWVLLLTLSGALCVMIFGLLINHSASQYKFRYLFGGGIFLFFVLAGYFISLLHAKKNEFDSYNQKGIYKVILLSPPIEKAKSFLCKVEVLARWESSQFQQTKGKAIVYLQKDSLSKHLVVGDQMLVEAEFAPPPSVQNPSGFDYGAYLNRQGIGATCYIPSDRWKLIGHEAGFSILRSADMCRNALLQIFKNNKIEGDEFAVLAALTLGYTDDLQPDLKTSYADTGAMHILSVSGMHVGIVYAVIAFFLSFLNKNLYQRILKVFIILLFLWAYAFLTGLSPAVVRAALMFSFFTLANCVSRKPLIFNTIFMSMFLMLIFQPNLIFDVGFQLSYGAVLSIIFFHPLITRHYQPNHLVSRYLWSTISVSLAAQIATTPFSLYYFHQFPNYFLLTNFFAIFLSTNIIYISIILLSLSFLPFLNSALAFLLHWHLWLLNHIIEWIQKLPFSISYLSLDGKQMLLFFVAIVSISLYFFYKKYSMLFIGILSLLIVCIINLKIKYDTLTSSKIIVYAGMKSTHVNLIHKTKNYVFSSDTAEIKYIAKPYWINTQVEKPAFISNSQTLMNLCFNFNGMRVLILDSSYIKKTTYHSPLRLDYLIIGNNLRPDIDHILQFLQPRTIIVDKSISKWYTDKIMDVCSEKKIHFYSIAKQGAFVQQYAAN